MKACGKFAAIGLSDGRFGKWGNPCCTGALLFLLAVLTCLAMSAPSWASPLDGLDGTDLPAGLMDEIEWTLESLPMAVRPADEGQAAQQDSVSGGVTTTSSLGRFYDASTGFTYECYGSIDNPRPISSSFILWNGDEVELDGSGVRIVDYDGSKGYNVSVPEKINGLYVISIVFDENNIPFESLDVTSCSMLGYFSLAFCLKTWKPQTIDVSKCSHLKMFFCPNVGFSALMFPIIRSWCSCIVHSTT